MAWGTGGDYELYHIHSVVLFPDQIYWFDSNRSSLAGRFNTFFNTLLGNYPYRYSLKSYTIILELISNRLNYSIFVTRQKFQDRLQIDLVRR